MTLRFFSVFIVLCAAGCTREPTWYDESKEYGRQREERIAQLEEQGLSHTNAARAFDLETAIRNTERPPMPPEQSKELNEMVDKAIHE
jgi:hypothetical protein